MKRESVKQELLKHELSFGVVLGRLKAALGLQTDAELAAQLGMSTGNFANRKKAGSIPFEIAIPLAISRSVSLDWLFCGFGDSSTMKHEINAVAALPVDSARMGLIFGAIEAAMAGDAADLKASKAAATQLGMLAAIIYNQVVFERDDQRHRAKVDELAIIMASVIKTMPVRESEIQVRAAARAGNPPGGLLIVDEALRSLPIESAERAFADSAAKRLAPVVGVTATPESAVRKSRTPTAAAKATTRKPQRP